LKKIFSYIKPYLFLAIISPLMMVLEVTGDLCLPKLMSYIVDYGISEGGLAQMAKDGGFADWLIHFLFQDDFTQMTVIVTFGVLMLLVTLLGGFFGMFCAYTSSKAAQSFGHDLRCDAYRKVMSLSIEDTDKFTTGSLVTRMTNDISMVTELVESLTRHFVRAPMFIIGGTIMLLSLKASFGLILLGSLPILGLAVFIILKKAIPMYSKVQKKLDKVNSVVQENVSGARVVKAYVCENYENERFEKANRELVEINLKVLKLMAFIMPILTIVQHAAVVLLIAIGAISINNGSGMKVGTLMAGITYVTQVISSIMMVTMMFQTISRATASGKRVSEVLNTEPKIVGSNLTDTHGKVAVSLRNVSFRYPNTVGEPILKNISLDVHQGETLAIIGSTGCGKTTLVSLIPRFYDATEGEILIDGEDIKGYNLHALRQKIGYVMQKSELFSDTIENNIKWGNPNATNEEIIEASDIAQATEFIHSQEGEYQNFIAEKGASLSGGQKQRLSIARALVRKPEILILDDATSALDLATESKLQKGLKEKYADKTVIMIAQRIASVRSCDRIAVLENGKIVDCAPHAVLMERCDVYKDIYASQMKQNEEGGEN